MLIAELQEKPFVHACLSHREWVARLRNLFHVPDKIFVGIGPIEPRVAFALCLYFTQVLEKVELGHHFPPPHHGRPQRFSRQSAIHVQKLPAKSFHLRARLRASKHILTLEDVVEPTQQLSHTYLYWSWSDPELCFWASSKA